MHQLTDTEIQRGRRALARLEKVWPRFCEEHGLTRTTDRFGSQIAAAGASVLAPRTRLGSMIRAGAHAASSLSGPGIEIPSLLRVWASPVGPVVAIPAGWISGEKLSGILDPLREELAVPITVSADSGSELHLTLRVADPLRNGRSLDYVPPVTDLRTVGYGIAESGDEVTIGLWDEGGVLAGGIPGSGKSAGAFLNLFGRVGASSIPAEFCVIDGKGGEDLSAFESRSFRFVRCESDEDLPAVNEALKHAVSVMKWRLSNQSRYRDGHKSFWACNRPSGYHKGCDGGGPTTDWPLVCVLLDEFPMFAIKAEVGSPDKELLKLVDDNLRLVRLLVRTGRSAGIVVCIGTQKPTNDSVPTVIRDNLGVRLAYRVLKREAAEAILGDVSTETDFQPTDIEQGERGVCAVAQAGKGIIRARSDYLPEYVIEQALQRIPARDPLDIAHELEARGPFSA